MALKIKSVYYQTCTKLFYKYFISMKHDCLKNNNISFTCTSAISYINSIIHLFVNYVSNNLQSIIYLIISNYHLKGSLNGRSTYMWYDTECY
jgi:hypothetical protein